jgi:hypothetical protein
VISFATHVASSLERLIVQKKRGRGEQRALASLAPPPRPRVSLPSQEERAHALASVLSRKPKRHASDPPYSDPPPVSDPPPASEDREPPTQESPPEPSPVEPPPSDPPDLEPTIVSEPPAERTEETPARTSRGVRPLAPALGSDAKRESAPPRSIAEALARPVIPVGRDAERPTDPLPPGGYAPGRRDPSLPPSLVDAGWEDLAAGRAPFGQRESGTHPGMGRGLAPPALAPREDSPDVSIESGPLDEELVALAQEHGIAEEPPRSRAAAHSARPLPARASAQDEELPSVIVDRT